VLALAGPFVGSLLGVLVMRLPEGRPVVIGRSACDECHRPLGPLDMVPLVSYAALRGRCRYCGARIAPIHPLIEMAALGVVVWAATATTGSTLIASCVYGWLLLALALTDLRSGVLPIALTLPLAAFGLIAAWEIAPLALWDHVEGMIAGFAFGAVIAVAYKLLRGGELRLQEAALLGAIGAWIAWQKLAYVMVLAAFVPAAALIGTRSKLPITMRNVLGAALALSGWLVWLHGAAF